MQNVMLPARRNKRDKIYLKYFILNKIFEKKRVELLCMVAVFFGCENFVFCC